jgi:hypothetical protein
MDGGFKLYALQNVNSSTNKGFCAVSNDKVSATKGGINYAVSGAVSLWASYTSGAGNKATLTSSGVLNVSDINNKTIFNTPAKETSNYVAQTGPFSSPSLY